MNKQYTIPILFHAGSYGTYLEWCLTTLTTDMPLTSPLTNIGNSHKFGGHHLLDINGWRRYVLSSNQWNFVRLHPKTTAQDSLAKNLNEISSQVEFFIYLYPKNDTLLLSLNNQFTKVWDDWWTNSFTVFKSISPDKIYENWPVPKETHISQIPNWIKREFLSYYLMPAYIDQIEWERPSHYNQKNCLFVSIDNLLYDFKDTISKIVKQSNLTLLKPIDELLPYHKCMVGLQKNINQDWLCKNIVTSTIDNIPFEWSNQYTTLAGESFVQWDLRNRGFEIRCNGLDMFPTNSLQLRELLYPV